MHESLILSKNLVFFCLLLGFVYSLLLYFRQHNFLNKKLLFLLSLSRFLLISFLAFLLLDPIVKSSKEIKEKPVVVILQDVSSSISRNIKNELEDFSNKLNDLDIYKYSFSDKIYDDFNEENNDFKILIANPKKGGEGISLHYECSNAIYIDRSYDAGKYLQSRDRIHRVGSKFENVNFYFFCVMYIFNQFFQKVFFIFMFWFVNNYT